MQNCLKKLFSETNVSCKIFLWEFYVKRYWLKFFCSGVKRNPLLGIFFISLFFYSCSTLKQDTVYSITAQKDSVKTVEQIEKDIVKQYAENNSAGNSRGGLEAQLKIKNDLDTLLAVPSTDSAYLAKIYALYADYFLLKRDKSSAKKMLKIAESNNPYEEYVRLVTARLIFKNEERRDYLAGIIKKEPTSYRLICELGYVYYMLESYTEALVGFDASLDFLPEEYTVLYGEKRDYCRKFYKVDNDIKKETALILERNKIFLSDMAALTQDNTHFLDFITGTNFWKPAMLAERLKAAGWYAPETDTAKDYTRRKDAALFLWHLIAGNDTEMLSRYSFKYSGTGKKSPIKDIEMDGIYFDSVLGVVEEDIIPLVDGLKFNPDGFVGGLEFYNWLKAVEAIK